MVGYLIVGGVLTVTVVVPAISVGLKVGMQRLKPKLRGMAGERKVNNCLRKFKGKEFAQMKDVMLPFQGKTSQIDNLLISSHGIFVIEMKNYKGFINGAENQPRWLQTLPGSNFVPREFFNPIWQNNGHIRALRNFLGNEFPNLCFHNVVVFSDECKAPQISGVVNLGKLKGFLKDKMKDTPVLTTEQVAVIKGVIEKNNIKDSERRLEHVAYAKESTFQARSREKAEIMRKRAEANKDVANEIQQAYTLGRLSLSQQIAEVERNGNGGEPRKSVDKNIQR